MRARASVRRRSARSRFCSTTRPCLQLRTEAAFSPPPQHSAASSSAAWRRQAMSTSRARSCARARRARRTGREWFVFGWILWVGAISRGVAFTCQYLDPLSSAEMTLIIASEQSTCLLYRNIPHDSTCEPKCGCGVSSEKHRINAGGGLACTDAFLRLHQRLSFTTKPSSARPPDQKSMLPRCRSRHRVSCTHLDHSLSRQAIPVERW